MSESGPSIEQTTSTSSTPPPSGYKKKASAPEFIEAVDTEQPETSWPDRIKNGLGLDLPARVFRRGWTRVSTGEVDSGSRTDISRVWKVFWKFLRFMGPGAIISVAYIDPDNYQTNLEAGQDFQYKLLFMILVSNIVAIYLQVSSFLQLSI
jgi:metal iron transporter